MIALLKKVLTSKTFYISALAAAVTAALLLLMLDQYIMPTYTNYDEGVTVPQVTQLSLDEADSLLASYGLRYEVAERRSNSAFPANYVIDQTPSPSEIVKPNRKVYLTVNTISMPKAVVPKVVNLSFRNAAIQLQNYGLRVGTVSYESSRFKSSVLRQSIAPGDTVPKGTEVDLTISDGLGEKMVRVPEITGLRLSEAQQKLRRAGLRIGELRFQPSREYPPNVVLDFTPKKEQLVEGTTLNLILSERAASGEEVEAGAVTDTTSGTDNDQIHNL